LPDYNIFGLSNTTYRTELLNQCLPVPSEAVLIDWYLATQAWLKGRNLLFDRDVRMQYRQHEGGTVALLPPFTPGQIREATRIVRQHFQVMMENPLDESGGERWNLLVQAARRIQAFADRALASPEWLDRYTEHLNQLEPLPLWWACVAHPKLEPLWTKSSLSE